jgi:hypothetical protein
VNHRTLAEVFAAAILAWACPLPAAVAEDNQSLGDSVQIGDQTVRLAEPTLTDNLNADEQTRQIETQLRGLSFRQFARDSTVAPVRINLRYIKDDSGRRLGHEIHLLFIVHESIDAFSAADFPKRLLGESDVENSAKATDAPAETLQKLGIGDGKTNASYKVAKFELLDAIQLSGLFRISQSSTQSQNRFDVSLVESFDNRWQSIDEPAVGGTYSGMRGWLTATALEKIDGVLVEARFVMHEPQEWFAGDNYLRSKLPLVLQEAARDLRRRLKRS